MSKTYIHKSHDEWAGEYEVVRKTGGPGCKRCAWAKANPKPCLEMYACPAGRDCASYLRRISPSVNTDKPVADNGTIRKFASGATRDTAQNKPEYDRYLSYPVMVRYGEYMMKHQIQSDGSRRDGDNWQKGFGLVVLMGSLFRHFVDVWGWNRKLAPNVDIEDSLCALRFNTDAMLHEILMAKTKLSPTAE